jgi:CheY-like chemotaxis protein
MRANVALGGQTVKLVALTGYAQAEDVKRALDSGFDAHVAKPMTPEHLLAVVSQVVSDKARN